jgi:hypothetical protein
MGIALCFSRSRVCMLVMPAAVGDELQQRITRVNEGIYINQRGGAMP